MRFPPYLETLHLLILHLLNQRLYTKGLSYAHSILKVMALTLPSAHAGNVLPEHRCFARLPV